MCETTFDLDQVLEGVSSVGISGHVRPDGDCVGSCLGLWLFLKTWYPNVEATVYLQPIPPSFAFLSGSSLICHDAGKAKTHDLFFLLDCSDLERLGEFAAAAGAARVRACIDHHVTGKPNAEYNHIRPRASSTCELVCDLIGKERITREMAEALYLGISHDTGVFQYSNTSSHTMAVAGMLMDLGIDFSRIVADTFYIKSYWQKQILGKALLESIRLMEGRVIFSAVRQKDLAFYQVTPGDLDGIVSELRSTRGVEAAIFLYELRFQEWKVSLRSSNEIDVSRIAAYFGGGGHVRAAGCTMQGTVYDVINNLTKQMELQWKEAPGNV